MGSLICMLKLVSCMFFPVACTVRTAIYSSNKLKERFVYTSLKTAAVEMSANAYGVAFFRPSHWLRAGSK